MGSIPHGLTPTTCLCLPSCKSTLGIQGGECGAANQGLGRSDGLNRCQGLSTAIYLALEPDLLESVPNICAIQIDAIQQGHTSLNKRPHMKLKLIGLLSTIAKSNSYF